jgi:hypothetical protein
MFKRKFEEEAAPAEAAPATDPATALVEALTAMGLSAEQAEAVHQMAMDLIAAEPAEAPAEEPTAVEASRQRGRARMSRGRKSRMSGGRSRSRMSRRGRSRFSAEGRPSRRPSRSRRTEMSREERTIARQRRQIAQMKREMNALGKAPAAQKLSANPYKANPIALGSLKAEGSSVKERVSNMMKTLLK